MHTVFVSSYLPVHIPTTAVLPTLSWTQLGRGRQVLVRCVVTLGCELPLDGCDGAAVVASGGWKWHRVRQLVCEELCRHVGHSTSACSFCVVILSCTHPNDGSPADTVVDTVGWG